MKKNKKVAGFTLIEVMIAVAVIGILAAIAYPSYDQYVKRTKRAEVQAYLMELSLKLASYKLVNQSYNGISMTNLGGEDFPLSGRTNYTLSLQDTNGVELSDQDEGVNVQSWVLVATPTITSSQKGTGVVSLSSSGIKCWYKNNDTANVIAKKNDKGNSVAATVCTNQWDDK